MTSRTSFSTKRRPLSAIYLGPAVTPNSSSHSSNISIPDLPEPPSPGSSSSASGLPSPPATNSTGSGSTGDNKSANAGSLRQRPTFTGDLDTKQDNNMHNGKSRSSGDDGDDDESGNGEDDTARLTRRRTPSANVLALQRVKSLTQRNKMAIDKLSSFSRLSTPSPSSNNRSRFAASPPPPSAPAETVEFSTSGRRSLSRSELNRRRQDTQLSGSETERESQHLVQSSSSDELTTPPSSVSATGRSVSSLSYRSHHETPRRRRTSAPASPAKALTRTSATSRDPSRSPRSRRTASISDHNSNGDPPDPDSQRTAMAPASSSRRSPFNGRRTRQPLPKEFREPARRNSDGRPPGEPSTPHRDRSGYADHVPSSPRSGPSSFEVQQRSPRAFRTQRSSTVRELTRRHQTRWLSEDLTSSQQDFEESHDTDIGRRQSRRSGSGELLSTGRSLVGEGLRAAGLARRRDTDEDVFKSSGGLTKSNGDYTTDRLQRDTHSTASGSSADWKDGRHQDSASRVSSAPSESVPLRSDLRASLRNGEHRASRDSFRPATTMADYSHPDDGRGSLRGLRSAYPLTDRETTLASVKKLPLEHQDRSYEYPPATSRGYASPYGAIRRHTPLTGPIPSAASGSSQHANSEHARLMYESLSMFESHLSRLPLMGNTTTAIIPEVFRSAQHSVFASDKLNSLLREGTNHALEQQIDAEVRDDEGLSGGTSLTELWRGVGAEYRESLRVSDELVRTMTGFLLGMGKILRETAAAVDSGQVQHSRSISLDDDSSRRPDVRVDAVGSSDGRRSTQSRRSWEPSPRDANGPTSQRISSRFDDVHARPPSVVHFSDRNEGREADQAPVASSQGTLTRSATFSSSVRRLYTPRELREQNGRQAAPPVMSQITSPSSIDGVENYEPSPTPMSRHGQAPAARGLAPLSIPPPLPSLPSETLLRRSSISDQNSRRKTSGTSVVTVRANPTFPAISTPNPTTAVTPHTVSNAPDQSFPLLRSDTGGSTRTSVTFSRPTTVSVSALNGLQQQHQETYRTVLDLSSVDDERPLPAPQSYIVSPQSGSETERDIRRRTLDGRARASLDSALQASRDNEGGSQSKTARVSSRRDRRPTISEVFS